MKNVIPEMESKSMDIVTENISKLKELFPEAFTEGKVDFDALKEVLGDYVDGREERYSFTWNGKRKARMLAQTPSTGTLRPCKEESVDWDTTQNLFIEGDNLEVLKLLQKSYYKKVKMIYIDPPYNTGKDFVYKDNFKDNIKNYKEITGQVDGEGRNLSSNPETSGRYHTDWLNMIYPRLKLARNLLTEDGIIFISIDDNEQSNLKHICDEIFGSENRLSTQHIQVRYANKTLNEKNDWQPVMEYIFVYAKNADVFIPQKEYEDYSIEKFRFEFKELGPGKEIIVKNRKVTVFASGEWEAIQHDEGRLNLLKETWVSGSIYSGTGNGEMVQAVIEPRLDVDGYGALYKIDGLGEDGLGYRYFMGPQSQGATRSKMFSGVPLIKVEELKNGTARKYKSISNLSVFEDHSPDFGNIAHEGGIKYNSGKKPIKLLRSLISIANLKKNDIVLDFFAGSGSTAHAVMQENADFEIGLKHILVQLPEPVSDSIKEQKDTYNFLTSINKKPFLTELSKERIKRSSEKVRSQAKYKYFDGGFKVFKLDSTNIKPWELDFDLTEQDLEDQISNIKHDRKEEDVLYEVLLKYGLDLTLPITKHIVAGHKVFDIGLGALMICLSDDITLDVVEGIAKLKDELNPEIMRVVFKDTGFADDVVKTNAVQILKQAGIEDVRSL
ncbi:DNA methylase [Halomonadaceae bacterium LMG 33818]|uniref:site-specific DNA-methyltransferase n=1 Tax=Cernens ardua TaxID=3402176 RepID=UPI003EDBFE8F